MVKIHGEPRLVQANEGQELGLGSLGDQMNLDVSFKGDSPPKLGLGSEWDVLSDLSSFVGVIEDEIKVKVAWAHLNMARRSWSFIDEFHALSLWIIVDH